MSEKNFQKNSGRVNPQKCSQCSQPGHNRSSKCCPVNINNAQKQQLTAQRRSDSSQILAVEKMQNSEYGRSLSVERSKFLSIEPPPSQSNNGSSGPPSDNINQLIDEYYQRLADREVQSYKEKYTSSCSMEILQLPEHPAILLANKFERKLAGSSLQAMSITLAAGSNDSRSEPEDPTARNLDFGSPEVGSVLPGGLTPSSPISSSLVVIAPPSEVASQEALVTCELSNSAVMGVESGINLDIEDLGVIQSLTSEPYSYFAGGAYLPADELDDQVHHSA